MSRRKKKRKTKEGIQISKNEDFAGWYTEVLKKAELIDYYDVSGCYILRPNSFFIWERIQSYFDSLIRKSGVRNCYFPLFVKKEKLQKEEDHVDGFSAEVAWVTRSGSSELKEPIAIRPTSETVMYSYYSKWVRSHRDLPLRLNQWCNVVRWEFSNPCPFIRSREFLWQEGHSAFAKKEEADKEVLEILNYYKQVYEELLAVPVIRGFKSENEKFPGGLYTTTVEAFVEENGRSIQAATSHSLGQNFSRGEMFDISFEDEDKNIRQVWQNSWGLSTRSIGALILIHGDDNGLVLPPRVAETQVVIVPILKKGLDTSILLDKAKEVEELITKKCEGLYGEQLRVKIDDRTDHTPGWKYNYWELRGIPLRIEIGPRDLKENCVVFCRRDTGKKEFKIPVDEDLGKKCVNVLKDIHAQMFQKAKEKREKHLVKVTDWKDFVPALNAKNTLLVPFCGGVDCEKQIKEKSVVGAQVQESTAMSSGAKSLCFPLVQDTLPENACCINPECNIKPNKWSHLVAMMENKLDQGYSEKDVVFPRKSVENIVKSSVSRILKDETLYDFQESGQHMNEIVEIAMEKLIQQNLPFKFIVTCMIMQNNGAGFHATTAAYLETWDGLLHQSFEFKNLYCVVYVYACAL